MLETLPDQRSDNEANNEVYLVINGPFPGSSCGTGRGDQKMAPAVRRLRLQQKWLLGVASAKGAAGAGQERLCPISGGDR